MFGITLSPLLRRGIRRGWASVWNGGHPGTTLLMLAVLLTLLQSLLLTHLAARGAHELLVSRGGLYLEVLPGASDQDIQELYAAIRELPYVEEVAYVPKDQAYAREKARNPDLLAFVETYGLSNPYPDSFSVTLASLDRYDDFSAFIGQEQWRRVVDASFLSSVTDQEESVRRLARAASALSSLSLLFVALAVLALLFLAAEIAARRMRLRGKSVLLETLLGASPADAAVPLAAETSFLVLLPLLVGTVIAVVLSLVLPLFAASLSGEPLFAEVRGLFLSRLATVFPLVLLFEIALVPVLSLAGVLIAYRRQLLPRFAREMS